MTVDDDIWKGLFSGNREIAPLVEPVLNQILKIYPHRDSVICLIEAVVME